MRLNINIIIDMLRVDFKRVANIEENSSIEYEGGSELKLGSLINELVYNRYLEYDDIDGNSKAIIKLEKPTLFKDLDISFKASSYTTIEIEFSDGSSLALNGENGDYSKFDYSFNELHKKIKYRNRLVDKIKCFSSLGAEEFNSINIKQK